MGNVTNVFFDDKNQQVKIFCRLDFNNKMPYCRENFDFPLISTGAPLFLARAPTVELKPAEQSFQGKTLLTFYNKKIFGNSSRSFRFVPGVPPGFSFADFGTSFVPTSGWRTRARSSRSSFRQIRWDLCCHHLAIAHQDTSKKKSSTENRGTLNLDSPQLAQKHSILSSGWSRRLGCSVILIWSS